ncbi:UDP-D-apiose/UDP-D-xylose synthase [Hordeum vulgare]|nr:UDP-D-apiose/UDP-D-xylose synthase [Hordeum vulgare]
MASGGRVDLDGGAVPPLTICMIGTGGFIGSHLCEKLMAETPHVVLAVNVYSDKIRHLVDPPPPHLARHISFHHLNIKNDPRLKGLVKMADLAITGISMPMGSDKLYSGSADGSVRVWDDKSGKRTGASRLGNFHAKDINSEPVAILTGHDRHVISLAVSTTRLYSGSLDKTIRVWDLKNLQCVQTLSEHKAAVTSELCWGQKLLSCSLDKTVKVWAASESGDLQLMHTHSEEH